MAILITGASGGIGEELAIVASQRKHDVVLVARSQDHLSDVAEKCTDYGVTAEIIVADLTVESDRLRVKDRIRAGDISVLINNAGFGSSGPFNESDIDVECNEIDLNIGALVELTHCALEHMVPQRMGTIINVSSIASYQPMTGNAVYGATKAFVTSFTHALREELSESGVNVMMVNPGMTRTGFQQRSRWHGASGKSEMPSFLWQSSKQVAVATFRGMDHQKGVVIPGVHNKILAALASSLPGSVTRKITAVIAKGRRTR